MINKYPIHSATWIHSSVISQAIHPRRETIFYSRHLTITLEPAFVSSKRLQGDLAPSESSKHSAYILRFLLSRPPLNRGPWMLCIPTTPMCKSCPSRAIGTAPVHVLLVSKESESGNKSSHSPCSVLYRVKFETCLNEVWTNASLRWVCQKMRSAKAMHIEVWC